METVLTDSGVAYHIMMFINREKTSTEHRICEDAFWNTMAEKKIFRGKSADELKTFFREKFWGKFKQFGIAQETYKILLQNTKVSYETDDTKREDLIRQIFMQSPYNIDDLNDKAFWESFFFRYPNLFDPLSVWDKNICEFRNILSKMPQLLKRKIAPSKNVTSFSTVRQTIPDISSSSEPMQNMEFETSTCIYPDPSNNVTFGNNQEPGKDPLNIGKQTNADSTTSADTSSCKRNKEISVDLATKEEAIEENFAAEVNSINHISALDEEIFETQSMEVTEEPNKACLGDSEEIQKQNLGNAGDHTTEKVRGQGLVPKSENIETSDCDVENTLKNLAMQSAMALLAAKRNKSVVAEFNHASAFFRVLTVMAKAAEALGLEDIIVEDWHNLSDVDAKNEFQKLASLSVIENDNNLTYISEAFIRLGFSFGRLLQLEKKMSEAKKKKILSEAQKSD